MTPKGVSAPFSRHQTQSWGRNATATLAARNLGVFWTEFTGVDPEAFGTTGDAPSSFQAFAPPTYLSFRLNLGF